MFWPIVLPFQITIWLFLVILVAAVFYAICSKRTTWKVVCISFGLALVAFVPSCAGVGLVLDNFRFGYFQHAAFDDVNDFRIERYLPTESCDIELFKSFNGNGYVAKYEIAYGSLKGYVDGMWECWGQHSAVSHSEFQRSQATYSEMVLPEFSDLGWSLEGEVVIFHSPVEGDGGGSTYYHELETGVTLQRAWYW